MLAVQKLQGALENSEKYTSVGRVLSVKSNIIYAALPQAALGDVCEIVTSKGKKISAQIVSFDGKVFAMAPYSDTSGISPFSPVYKQSSTASFTLRSDMLGKVFDACGKEISAAEIVEAVADIKEVSGRENSIGLSLYSKKALRLNYHNPAPLSLKRKSITDVFETGIKSIDGLCTLGKGQRIGLFAGAGVGKSTLLGMIARNSNADVNVIALVGERGREVNEFISESLGQEGLSKSVLVVATSDESALRRSVAALTATSIAEYYRSKGKSVLLLIDSLTRSARAIRDVSLAAGELPIRQGLTNSVYSELPKLIERAGNDEHGSITAIYTILDTAEYELDPLAEELKSLLDGHLVLSYETANKGIRPAIDFTKSVSRLAGSLQSPDHRLRTSQLLKAIARIKKEKDLITLGGSADHELKLFLQHENLIGNFLNQAKTESYGYSESLQLMTEVALGLVPLGTSPFTVES